MSNKQSMTVKVVDDAAVIVITDEEGKQRTCTLTSEEARTAGEALIDRATKAGPHGQIGVRVAPDD